MNYTLQTAIYAVLAAFVIDVCICPIIIPMLTKLKFGQTVRTDGPETHIKKTGTPTMGGVMILISIALVSLFFTKDNPEIMAVLLTTIGFGIVGFVDDYIKVVKKSSDGLNPKQKLLGQFIICTAFLVYMYKLSPDFFNSSVTSIVIPFTDGKIIDLGYIYIPAVYITMLGTVNGVNLTDGLDGLASGVTVLVVTFFLFVGLSVNSGVTPIAGAAVGALLGFLLFNSHPAKVFMGDTGSLALGGLISAMAIILKMPIFIVIVGFIYVLETISVMIQVSVYKKTKKRVFKMAPIHHHFEKSGWSETKIVTLFYIITAICCLIGYLGARNIFS